MFTENSKTPRSKIKNKILEEKLIKYICAECGIDEWRGNKLSLHLDHKNGINNDNRLENLRFLCPNCHSLTDTYCGNNNKIKFSTKKKKVSDEDLLESMKLSKTVNECLTRVNLAGANNYPRVYKLADKFDIAEFKHPQYKHVTIEKYNEIKMCEKCNNEFMAKKKNQKFCCKNCVIRFLAERERLKTKDIKTEEILKVWEKNNRNFLKTSKEIGLSDNGIRKRLKSIGINIQKIPSS